VNYVVSIAGQTSIVCQEHADRLVQNTRKADRIVTPWDEDAVCDMCAPKQLEVQLENVPRAGL
jgi:hypothetical protein